MLSRKYYKIIAQCIKKASYDAYGDVILHKDDLVHDLCNEFKADNGMFNRDRFVDACD